MNLKIESDLHIEFKNHEPDLSDVQVYVIAGDLGLFKNEKKWLIDLTNKYPNVEMVVVSGNHSFYDTNIEKVDRESRELSKQYERIHYLQNDSIVLNGFRFITSTLWTDFNKGNPTAMYLAQARMNDYKQIRYHGGASRLTPYRVAILHKQSKDYIFKTLNTSEEPCFVISHHRPYIERNHMTDELSPAYEVDLLKELDKCKKLPIAWFHGHDHVSSTKIIEYGHGSVEFISNQKGYPNEESGFDPNFIYILNEDVLGLSND